MRDSRSANRAALVSTHVGRVGVHALAQLVEKRGHAFREHMVHDLGVDAHIELFDGHGHPTGRFVAVQIKSGKSYFRRRRENVVEHFFEDRHRSYWQQHQMPVILVLHDPDSNQCIWQQVCSRNVIRTAKRWRIDVPLDNDLSASGAFVMLEAISASQSDARICAQRPRSGQLHVYRQIDPDHRDPGTGYPFCATDEGGVSLLVIAEENLCYSSHSCLTPDEFSKEFVRAGFSLEFNIDVIGRAIRSAFGESHYEVQFWRENKSGRFDLYIGPDEKYYMSLRKRADKVLVEAEPAHGPMFPDLKGLFVQLKALFAPAIAFTRSEIYRQEDPWYQGRAGGD